METVGASSIWSFLDDEAKIQKVSNQHVRADRGHLVGSYLDLAAKVAELQFRNRDHVLFFRGQGTDHATPKGTTTLKPSILRPPAGGARLGPIDIQGFTRVVMRDS